MLFILAEDIESTDEGGGFACLEGQVETADAEMCAQVFKRPGAFDAFGVNLHADDGDMGIQLAEALGGFESGVGFGAVAEIKIARTAAGDEVGGVLHEKGVHAAQAVAGGLAARDDALRAFGGFANIFVHSIIVPAGGGCVGEGGMYSAPYEDMEDGFGSYGDKGECISPLQGYQVEGGE